MEHDLKTICRDLPSFSWWLFGGCAQQGRTHMHFEQVIQARLLDGRRKTHQPAGGRLARDHSDADALRQRINRAYLSDWDDDLVRSRLHAVAMISVPEAVALVVDDTGILKKGKKSPGVHRQYTGTAGKVANCQVVVSTHVASHAASVPLEMDLYVPNVWCEDAERRAGAWIPEELEFRTKPELALEQIDRILDRGGAPEFVLADAGYGDNSEFREALVERGLGYAVGVKRTVVIWRPGEGPEPAAPSEGPEGRPPRMFPGTHEPISILDFALEVPEEAWHDVELRPGAPNPRMCRFTAHRIRTASRARAGKPPGREQWLLIQWPADADAPSHYFLMTSPANTSIEQLARTAKLRWRVERDYQDIKGEVGFTHYEGRRYRGFQHHLTICMAAIAFMVASRALFPPQPSPNPRRAGSTPPVALDLDPGPLPVL